MSGRGYCRVGVAAGGVEPWKIYHLSDRFCHWKSRNITCQMRLDEESLVRQRVETLDGQHRGTVLFDGEVAGTNGGRWLGVDWDEPGRGKHDGCYKDTRYFHSRYITHPY